ncbi:hypothetical protein BKA93DRAFT_228689 [Sparassis latifolia]
MSWRSLLLTLSKSLLPHQDLKHHRSASAAVLRVARTRSPLPLVQRVLLRLLQGKDRAMPPLLNVREADLPKGKRRTRKPRPNRSVREDVHRRRNLNARTTVMVAMARPLSRVLRRGSEGGLARRSLHLDGFIVYHLFCLLIRSCSPHFVLPPCSSSPFPMTCYDLLYFTDLPLPPRVCFEYDTNTSYSLSLSFCWSFYIGKSFCFSSLLHDSITDASTRTNPVPVPIHYSPMEDLECRMFTRTRV